MHVSSASKPAPSYPRDKYHSLHGMHRPQLSALLPLALAPIVSAAGGLACEKIRVDGVNFDLSKLGGPHSVVTSRWDSLAETHHNTTYTVDVCKPLKKSGKSKKGEECPNGTRGTY